MVKIRDLGDRELILIDINGYKFKPEEIKEICIPSKVDPYWRIDLTNGNTIDATGNIIIQYKL